MGFINRLEQGLEKAVRGTFSKGGSEFEPVDLANRIRTEMDDRAYAISSDRTIAPNVFTIGFAVQDFPRVQQWGAPLAEELCDVAIRHARTQGYSLRGSVRVTFSVDDVVEPGEFEISSAQERVAAPRQQTSAPASMPQRITQPAHRGPSASRQYQPDQSIYEAPTQLSPTVASGGSQASYRRQPQVVLDINGESYSVRSLPVVLGRGSHADITVEDSGVSRRHLEIMEQDGVYLAVDLGSTNGSYINGEKLSGRRAISNGTVITMGRARIVFRLMVPRGER